MISKSFHCHTGEQLVELILHSITPTFQPTLAIVFSSVNQNLEGVRQAFADLAIDLIGCSTAGEIVDHSLYEQSIACLLLDLDRSFYRVKMVEYGREDVLGAAQQVGQYASQSFEHPGLLIMSGGMTIDAQQLIDGIHASVDGNIPVYGGLAGDDLEMTTTFAFTKQKITANGIVALVLDTDKVSIQGFAISGWEPVGGVNVITKSIGNIVYEINDEPAYDVFIRYFGLSDDKTKSDQLISIQTNYPFQIIKTSGYSILRSPLVVDEHEGTITLAAAVQEGDTFRFSNAPGFEVIDQTVAEFSQLYERAPEADALILFSCKGRHGAFGPMLIDEIRGIYDYWKKPMVGFLSYGEFGNMKDGRPEFHNETCALAILKER
ncbi:MAG: FIST N-terminal domain-containing protein [Saprospiraceae bacterium]